LYFDLDCVTSDFIF